MRRVLVLLCLAWAMLLGGLVQHQKPAADIPTDPLLEFPYMVADTGLLVLGLGGYEGHYLEDGSDAPVADVAALLVQNASETMLERGAVVLQTNRGNLVFELYCLPPGATVFVQEAGRASAYNYRVEGCDGWVVPFMKENQMDSYEITRENMADLIFTNITQQSLPSALLHYKQYDSGSGIYMGGICYKVELPALAPGESAMLSPYRYVHGYARVVAVTDE